MKKTRHANNLKFIKAIELLKQGFNQKETAQKIGVTPKTLDTSSAFYSLLCSDFLLFT